MGSKISQNLRYSGVRMRKLSTLAFAMLLTSVLAVAASAQAKPSETAKPKAEETKPKSDDSKKPESAVLTKWEVSISAPGQEYAGVLTLEKAGDSYKGSLTTELGEAPLSGIKVDGDSFTSAISVNAMGQTIEGTVSGKAKDGKISGELNLNGLGVIPYAGKKQ
jgi:curli biogenesis system outer membrane secretion channel CsgG